MKKVKFNLFLFSVLLCSLSLLALVDVKAQQFEFGGGLGVATYSGDIVRRLDKGNLGAQGTLFGRRNFDNVWSLRLGLSYGRLSAADIINPIDAMAEFRDAYFKGNLFEVSAVMEYHFLDYLHPQSAHRFSPYGFFGLGFSYFNGSGAFGFDPSNPDRGGYSLATPVIPFGIGVKYKLNNNWGLALEMGFRATFSDLIDRIDSQARFSRNDNGQVDPLEQIRFTYYGNPSDRDWYYFLGLTVSYSITTVKCYAY
ncbi:Outer membrane protein beta-barrel domain-containing protein [Belliella buryatensis]|uniref:Outer membrane protein beta-barrel domain-containing protein n=1 Tax=Belliella buryatensis TaxID=1500549 RepID=A0A239BLN2_9BACT|nr:DUF6089 family protein [Belliella buryatensis]SNS07944.1 Outer membrane protein beta-barrel domain-containing protein [Belliella buryatensis]